MCKNHIIYPRFVTLLLLSNAIIQTLIRLTSISDQKIYLDSLHFCKIIQRNGFLFTVQRAFIAFMLCQNPHLHGSLIYTAHAENQKSLVR